MSLCLLIGVGEDFDRAYDVKRLNARKYDDNHTMGHQTRRRRVWKRH